VVTSMKRRLASQSHLARDTRRDLPSIRSSTFASTLFVAFEESSRRCERRLSPPFTGPRRTTLISPNCAARGSVCNGLLGYPTPHYSSSISGSNCFTMRSATQRYSNSRDQPGGGGALIRKYPSTVGCVDPSTKRKSMNWYFASSFSTGVLSSKSGVRDLRQSRRLGFVNRSKRYAFL
jgi:hypothetical protein